MSEAMLGLLVRFDGDNDAIYQFLTDEILCACDKRVLLVEELMSYRYGVGRAANQIKQEIDGMLVVIKDLFDLRDELENSV